jgi:hypothetical protein
MFPSFPHYKEGTGGRGQIEPGPPVVFLEKNFQNKTNKKIEDEVFIRV